MRKPAILIVDDDPGHQSSLSILIKGWGYEVFTADNGALAVENVRKRPFDAVLMDVRMAEMDGIEALRRIKEYNPAVPVLIMTAYSSVDSAVQALKSGAYDYLTKPLDFDELRITLERALDHTRLAVENRALKEQLPRSFQLDAIIGKSPSMQALLEMVAMVAPSEATVLITGESGTGKELVAKAIHGLSPRKNAPLVTVNCAALSETLLESELFGHEKGAFTGADRRREGRFVLADKGVIFLDEIGEIPLPMQAKLLRVLQEREVQRVGSDTPIQVDVRIIAATNRDLSRAVSRGEFREDLFYRLNVVTLRVPPLRERKEDLPLLAQHFLTLFGEKNRKNLRGFTPQAMDLLLRHDWPGNVRELENAVERAVIMAMSNWVGENDLPLVVLQGSPDSLEPSVEAGARPLEVVEKEAVLSTLEQTGGNKSEAARLLGISRVTLHKKLKKYGI
jgi:two-component system, NtrC family, response regulator HydG